ncbi:hypothetical protein RRG08_066504 [Elysia crispata]|uniref:Uncharacterized protein n=1 Tax=Elysia crispata TaxID=231223 RepID=A0AAE0YJ80_9GAST|nr:hypothetical protein RRG08_066504 [Elysia crispata]
MEEKKDSLAEWNLRGGGETLAWTDGCFMMCVWGEGGGGGSQQTSGPSGCTDRACLLCLAEFGTVLVVNRGLDVSQSRQECRVS